MKTFYTLLLLIFLTSCGSANIAESPVDTSSDVSTETTQDQTDMDTQAEDAVRPEESDSMSESDTDMPEDLMSGEMSDDIEADMATLDEAANNEVMTLDASYKNPKVEVDMMINYSLASDNTIESIEVTATTYDITEFNSAVQELVGQDISQAEDFYAAGSSLTSDAFTSAIKAR